jgi:hypothetical protein
MIAQRRHKPKSMDDSAVEQVEHLLAARWSRRMIARHVGIGKSSVDRIAAGLRQLARDRRCRGCGGKLVNPASPCLVCQLRNVRILPS